MAPRHSQTHVRHGTLGCSIVLVPPHATDGRKALTRNRQRQSVNCSQKIEVFALAGCRARGNKPNRLAFRFRSVSTKSLLDCRAIAQQEYDDNGQD